MTVHRRHAYAACGLAIVALATANIAGLRFNATPSMPRGLWRVVGTDAPLHRGEIVSICPPETAAVRLGAARGYIPPGRCAGGFEPLVKPVAATAGDVVAVAASGLAVNGAPLQGTFQLAQDSAGRFLRGYPAGAYQVAQGEVWLVSAHDARSFDSRYFGPVPAANVLGVARPVWVLRRFPPRSWPAPRTSRR